ncbi:uncharacterized protein LOC133178587 [Saccostrea echinata]|uniref:uncharacterized protein LOC133178587 n=1 Tax=Saccostrea echinata TaxID=191078 RepID=UPI002A8202C3|nr:uncharacterized protein LOC133178587 [Saccostrea echinata]
MSTQGCSLKELKRHFDLSSHNHNSDELYAIAGSLTPTQRTSTKCRQYVAEFEEKHLFYFSLFKPKYHDASHTWIRRVKEDIKNSKRSGAAPTLREIYAVSEIIETVIFLLFEGEDGTMKALKIQSVIRENDADQPPLVLLLITNTECPCFQRIEGNVADLKRLHIEIINANHTECLDKRFRNNFKDLQRNFMLVGEDNDSSSKLAREHFESKTNIFSLCSQIIYGNKDYAQAVRECVKMHMEGDDFREVYLQFVDVKSYVTKHEYTAMETISDTGKKEKVLAKLTKEAFEKHLTEWQCFTLEDFFAIASVYNVEVFVIPVQKEQTTSKNDNKGTKLFLPICGSYLYAFKTPFVFQKISEILFKGNLNDHDCLCCMRAPDVCGNFPIINDEIDLRRLQKLDIKTCCPNSKRHGRHRHFQHLWNHEETEENMMQESSVTEYSRPMSEHIEKILEIMAEEGKTLDAINGGKGTLSMCISKEIFDNENTSIPVSLPVDDVQKSFEIIADWTEIPVFVFLYSESVYQWVLISPRKCNKARSPTCRYYMTILYNRESGYFDRIIPKTGCNCLQVHPYVAASERDLKQVRNSKVTSKERHWPLITFLPEKPKPAVFTEDIRQEMKVIPMYSEALLIMERDDMKDRLLDNMSDYAYSLYRCISKEIFGNEEQFKMIMMETVKEIKENPDVYGHLLMKEKENSDSDFLENFKYRAHHALDVLRFHKTLVKESAYFFADRIEDGMDLGDLELFAVATLFQVPIYVLCAKINKRKFETEWTLFTQIVRKKQPNDFAARRQYLAGENAVHKCVFDASSGSNYYVTLYRTFSGHYHRIVPKDQVCNCLKEPPRNVVEKHKHTDQPDFTIFFEMTNVKNKLTIAKLQLDNWLRCNMALEIFCTDIIDKLEGRRQNANISNIFGSSVGLVGSALAIAGLITAPFTAGVSLGLAVAGGVIGTLGSATVIGTQITEFVLTRDAISMLERYQMNLRERSRCMEKSISDLQKEMERFIMEDTNNINATAVQTATGALRMLGGLPIIIARVVVRAVTLADAILPPLSIILDLGILAYSIYNLATGSKTNVTERLRKVRSVLRTTRIQMFTWGYGNQKNYMQTMENLKIKRT